LNEVIKEVKQAEKRIGHPITPKQGDIYYRWSSLGRAHYIEPKWEFLSNMSPFPVVIEDITYPSVEHYWHVMKYIHARENIFQGDIQTDPAIQSILSTKSPYEVLKLSGRNGEIGKSFAFSARAWSKIKHQLLEKALRAKVEQYPGIKRLLMESDKCTIAERMLSHRKSVPPTAEDVAGMMVLWKGQWYGDNSAGKVWMKIRDELIADSKLEEVDKDVGKEELSE